MPSFDSRGCGESHASDRLSLWWAPLDVSDSALRVFATCLSSEERRHADQFARPLDRGRFVAARGWLRHLVGALLDCAPGDVEIVTGDRGKPRVAGSDFEFSASRTAAVALYATSRKMEVGVDVEAIRSTINIDGMRKVYVTSRAARARLPPSRTTLEGASSVLDPQRGLCERHRNGSQLRSARRGCLVRRPSTGNGVGLDRAPSRPRSRFGGRGRWSERRRLGSANAPPTLGREPRPFVPTIARFRGAGCPGGVREVMLC